MLDWTRRLRRTFYDLRTEGQGPAREAAALAAGVFIGCTPFYGFHLLLCWIVGRLARLNRLKMYLAANISNPLFSPVLILTELQVGAWARRKDLHDLTLASVSRIDPWTFAVDLLTGSVIVGCVLALATAGVTLATGGVARNDPLATLWTRASDPYLEWGITAWEFARGKLRADPVYRMLVRAGPLPSGHTMLDVGCGQGLSVSALREAGRLHREGRWPYSQPPPLFTKLIGVELRPRIAAIARRALGHDAEILQMDARATDLPPSAAVLFLDVLHMMPFTDQEILIERAVRSLEPGGVVLLREADASGGARFTNVKIGNRLKAILTGNWRQRFFFRTHDDWCALLTRHGLDVSGGLADQGTPFANSVVRGVRRHGRPSLHEGPYVDDRVGRLTAPVVLAAEPDGADQRTLTR
jgi:uncharacterized protein (DUF2062 family)/SAM-dependent methyltransferase